ncbi:9258_t:CDS:2 [Funneliformis geosporum]|uniref:9258_t:CDS:1 n=1 Tax=Funneliformis geosporum TaxID=1117311 RepID=A0A9W4SXZ2_9GLOM|nr:9258_t:CDS:2 [Funneliformis geosporum]
MIVDLIKSLLLSIPSYILSSLPAIATIGASPMRGFLEKLMWVFRCLGCPFTGLYYTCNISNDEASLCIYWLEAQYFRLTGGNHDEENFKIEGLPYRPLGIHYKSPIHGQFTQEINDIIEECTAQASVLERLSSLPPAYYMGVGIFAGISRLIESRDCEFMPHITDDPEYLYTILTGIISIVIPWTVVIMANLTPPVGCLYRCKYLSALASTWSFNSFLAMVQHLMGEQSVKGNKYLHIWFSISGVIIVLLLSAFVVITSISLWVDLFGDSCSCTIVHEMNE